MVIKEALDLMGLSSKREVPRGEKYIVTLKDEDQTVLNALTRKGRVAVRRLARAKILFHDSPTARSGSGGIGRGLDHCRMGASYRRYIQDFDF